MYNHVRGNKRGMTFMQKVYTYGGTGLFALFIVRHFVA